MSPLQPFERTVILAERARSIKTISAHNFPNAESSHFLLLFSPPYLGHCKRSQSVSLASSVHLFSSTYRLMIRMDSRAIRLSAMQHEFAQNEITIHSLESYAVGLVSYFTRFFHEFHPSGSCLSVPST